MNITAIHEILNQNICSHPFLFTSEDSDLQGYMLQTTTRKMQEALADVRSSTSEQDFFIYKLRKKKHLLPSLIFFFLLSNIYASYILLAY